METETIETGSRGEVMACRMDVFDPAQKARHDELQQSFPAVLQEARELPHGYAYRLAPRPEVFLGAAEWITLDRLCCPFIDFRLEWKNGETWLSLTGSTGVKEFLTATREGVR